MKVLVSGYYGFGNAGDELILDTMISELRARQPDIEITVLSQKPAQTAQTFGIRAISRWDWKGILTSVRNTDGVISGGGGLFQDDTGSLSLYYYLAIILMARIFRKDVFVYGVGVNELKGFNRWLTAKILSMARMVTVREGYSEDLLKKWGCPPHKIEVTADPVLLRQMPVQKQDAGRPRVCMILRPPRRGTRPVELFAKLADSLNQRLSAQILFMPMHPRQDRDFTVAVMGSMRSPSKIVAWNTFAELHETIGASDLVISQRLHGLILAALYGVPLIGISDDPKIDRFLRELGQRNITRAAEATHYALMAVILDLWEWREDFRKNADQLLPTFKTRAKRITDLFFVDDARPS